MSPSRAVLLTLLLAVLTRLLAVLGLLAVLLLLALRGLTVLAWGISLMLPEDHTL